MPKKTAITPPAPPDDDEEYEFSRLTKDKAEFAEELPAACWWEYLRESERARAAVAQYRSGSVLLSLNIETIRNIVGGTILSELAFACPSFPSGPWLGLKGNERRLAFDIVNRSLTPAAWITADTFSAFNSQAMEPSGPRNVSLPILGGSAGARGTSRRSVLMTVNWESHDEQILENVGAWLAANRPKTHRQTKRRPLLSGGNINFETQYRAAMKWLAPLRLYKALGSWRLVAETLVPNQPHQTRGPSAMRNAERLGALSDKAESSRMSAMKARRIVAWLDGTRRKP